MNQPALPARRSTAAPQNAAVTLTPNELVPVLLEEAKRNRTAIAAIFTGVALLTLVVGLLVLPKNYTASTTILAQESDIIQPLLKAAPWPPRSSTAPASPAR